MNSPIIPPSRYVYDTAVLVKIFSAAHADFITKMAKYKPATQGHSMNAAFAESTGRDLETAQRLVANGIDLINLPDPLTSPHLGLTPALMIPNTKSLTEQVMAVDWTEVRPQPRRK